MFPLAQIDPAFLVLTGIIAVGLSGFPGLFMRGRPGLGQKTALLLLITGCLSGFGGALATLVTRLYITFSIDWSLPFGPADITIDPLSALFLLPIFVVSACAAIYGQEYWTAAKNRRTEPKLTFFFGLLAAAMASVVVAAHGLLFLMAWEVMALSAYFTLTTSDDQAEVRQAGTLYLITTHIGTLALFALFALLRSASGSFSFPAAGTLDGTGSLAVGIFIATVVGFGMKAGLMPLHIWLPSAHANAPSHVSALMSGVLIKTGIYGIVRIFGFFDTAPPWWGITVLVLGIVSGIAGVAFAIGQHDLKRLLAYHSIENIGIIAMGIGVALIGKSIGSSVLVMLGITGALLHVLNHATFKSLLFLSAGSVIHAIGTREIDLMGGVMRRAPYTAGCFLVGAVAICGLPPLNGFISEFLIYLGFFSGIQAPTGTSLPFLALAVPSLALIGGLAVACFIKVYGIAFLGLPRSAKAAAAHESGWTMRGPMVVLASVCGLIGLFPLLVAQLLEHAAVAWQPGITDRGIHLATIAPFEWLTLTSAILLAVAGVVGFHFRRKLRLGVAGTGTWDCGYLRPAPTMQYTASSFGDMLVKNFAGLLRPHEKRPSVKGPFPSATSFSSHVPEAVLDLIYLPFLRRGNEKLSVIRRLQHGQVHLYILYTLVTLVLLFAWKS